MQVWSGIGRALGRTVADLLFPPVCSACGVAVDQPAGVCPTCWSSLRFLERPYCDILCLPFPYDQPDQTVSPEAIADPPDFQRLRSVVLYDEKARRLVSALKYHDRLDLVPLMASWMVRAGREVLEDADLIVPVPLHRRRLLHRQFNQSAELARRIARLNGKDYGPTALVRKKATVSQVGLKRNQRRDNVKGVFETPPAARDLVRGRSILLVDDVFTTGATVGSATKALKRAGAGSVAVLTFARVAAFEG
ncbi:ComF family protein [Fulvimarina endophytica]|uniref:ComF family protein n=1 Tax=Fulvimarina endophytica TaxID=2293836 RepID=A0A371XAQ4_9HYPH|nr:ComF family protein [Fulvimarina endophytica]RFC66316.1 ComF family protein [Fulvimarina endophytica]